jgi:Uncharacterized protein conserved in bacteria, prophage-related
MIALDIAIKAVGGLANLARLLPGAPTMQRISNWRARGVPTEECPAIEQATAGAVTCEELRPDIRWVRIADKEWPHQKGRPLVDHASTNIPSRSDAPAPAEAA